MTARDKADELIDKLSPKCAGNSQTMLNRKLAGQCAIIAVKEIIKHNLHLDKCIRWGSDNVNVLYEDLKFWEQVLTELKAMQ